MKTLTRVSRDFTLSECSKFMRGFLSSGGEHTLYTYGETRATSRRHANGRSNAVEHGDRAIAFHVAGVERRLWLQEQDVCLFVCYGQVLGAARHDGELALAEIYLAVL